MSNTDNNENNRIKLEIKDQKLRDRGIVQSFELDENENTNTIILKFNTIYDKTTVPITFLIPANIISLIYSSSEILNDI